MTPFGLLLADLAAAGVDFVVIGGIATIGHGVVRATADVDIVVEPAPENLAALAVLLTRWRATEPDGTPVDLARLPAGRSLNLNTPHGPLDILSLDNLPLDWDGLRSRAEVRTIDGVAAALCSLADLVALKRIAGRGRDLEDLSALEQAHGPLPDARDL